MKRLTPPTPGARLKELRIASKLEIAEIAKLYAGGTKPDRIRQIEAAPRVNIRVEACYRAVVTTLLWLRNAPEAGR